MIARLICWWKGHKRGRRIETPSHVREADAIVGLRLIDLECPRCKARWTRRERKG